MTDWRIAGTYIEFCNCDPGCGCNFRGFPTSPEGNCEAILTHVIEDGSFDAATVGFGVRNLEELEAGLRELRRVLRPGGRIGILEITRPRGLLRPFYKLWFDGLVPLAGKLLPGGSAYTYLPASVRRFPGAKELAELMQTAGFEQVHYRLFGGGIVALHTGVAA